MTPEGRVKRDIKKFLIEKARVRFAGTPRLVDSRGWMYMPSAGPFGVSGVPDFCGIYDGRPFYIEAKADDNAPTENQKARIKEILEAGGIAIVAYSAEDVERAMKIHFGLYV